MGFSNLPLALSFRVEIVAALRFGKALATIRSRHMRKVKKRARQFLSRADTCQNQLDERKPINSHWLKHANLMPVLNYLASKAEGLDWCQTRHLLSLLALCLEIQVKMWEYPHLTCFAENRTGMTKTGGKNQASVDQRTSGIQALCKAVCQSISFHEAFEWHCNPWITHQRPKTPLQLLTIEHLWGFEQELQLPINRDPQRKTLTPWKLPVWLQDPIHHARASVAEERCRCITSAVSPANSNFFSSENSQFWTREMNAICREKSAICSESVRSVESKKNGDFIFFCHTILLFKNFHCPIHQFWVAAPRNPMWNAENSHVSCVKQTDAKYRECTCPLCQTNICEMPRIHMSFASRK